MSDEKTQPETPPIIRTVVVGSQQMCEEFTRLLGTPSPLSAVVMAELNQRYGLDDGTQVAVAGILVNITADSAPGQQARILHPGGGMFRAH